MSHISLHCCKASWVAGRQRPSLEWSGSVVFRYGWVANYVRAHLPYFGRVMAGSEDAVAVVRLGPGLRSLAYLAAALAFVIVPRRVLA
jgi:hypothetical protein